ncbi:nucleoporin GLE1-like protein [Leptotrombidium deliense]|uniref:mRNA export factor GLE1 n=1 Tax=Leptotrombidium deliense TaxID=299467 RepID=A0A443SIM0_9ACAR|nr:nucleoporin GLE1-like protein [Leptotrombidium deliense]
MKHYNEDFDILVEEVKKKVVILNKAESMKYKMKEIENKHRKTIEEEREYMTKKINEEKENMSRKINEERCALVTKARLAAESIVMNVEKLSEDNTQLINDMKLNHSVKQQHSALLMNLNNIEICLTKKVLSEEDICNVEIWKNEMETTMRNYEQQLSELQLRQNMASNLEKLKQEQNNTKSVSKSQTGENISESFVASKTYIDNTALKSYENLQLFFNDFENRLQPFIKDVSWKNYRTTLQLFIRTNVNAISSHSMDHLRSRIKNLTFLFSGKENEFQGKQISCNKHSEAANFCMYWAAKTFISVSTKQAIPKSVFPIAVQKCPYVVPCYPQREADDTEANYLIACGYDYSADGKSLETEESFLNRMRALVRLYGAIVQTNKQGLHPHGINCGWLFIARILNLEPRPAITAATIHAFLSTAAYRLCATYRKQFFKLLQFIMNDFIPRIEKCSSKDIKKQAVSQLKTLIEEFNRNILTLSTLKKPEGLEKLEVIPNNF